MSDNKNTNAKYAIASETDYQRYNADSILQFAIEHGMINLAEAVEKMEVLKEQKYLKQHTYKVFYDEYIDRWRTTFPDPKVKGGRRYIKRKTESEIQKAIIEFYKAQEVQNQYTVLKAMSDAIDRHYQGINKASSKERARQDMNRFYSPIFDKPILNMTEYDWECYLEDIVVKLNPKRKAFSNCKCLLRLTLRTLKRQGLLDINIGKIFEDIEIDEDSFDYTEKTDEEEVFSIDEFPILIRYLWQHKSDPECLLLLLIAVTGMRVGEATTLKNSDIDNYIISVKRSASGCYKDEATGKVIQSRVKEDDKAKTSRSLRDIVVSSGSDIILEEVKLFNPDSEFIFLNKDGKVFTRSAITHKLERICAKLNIVPKATHKLRKTYLSILSESQLDEAAIISQAGHTDFAITRAHYIRDRNRKSDLREKLNNISDLDISTMINENQAIS